MRGCYIVMLIYTMSPMLDEANFRIKEVPLPPTQSDF